MYPPLPSFVLGFHGCDKSLGMDIINKKEELKSSENDWDWLGTGMYFWEQDPKRAYRYSLDIKNAKQHSSQIKTKEEKSKYKPFVIGAIIRLDLCLNLLEQSALEEEKKLA